MHPSSITVLTSRPVRIPPIAIGGDPIAALSPIDILQYAGGEAQPDIPIVIARPAKTMVGNFMLPPFGATAVTVMEYPRLTTTA